MSTAVDVVSMMSVHRDGRNYLIAVPIKPGKGEEGCSIEVSPETVELVARVAGEMEPLRASQYGDPTPAERQRITDRQTEILEAAFLRSGRNYRTGLELAVFAVFRFGHKYKCLQWLARELDKQVEQTSKLLTDMVKKCNNAHNPNYWGPRGA